jgi:ketosteroid isomerase-like protein
MTGTDVRDIGSLIDAFGTALHARDVQDSMALLDDDPELIVIPSEGVDMYRGPGDVRSFLSRIYRGPRTYGWRLDDRVISSDGDAAWFTALGDETVEEDGATVLIPYCLTGVAVKRTDGWRLRLLHASEDSSRSRTVDTRISS